MNFSHVAVFALLGWYLMVRPHTDTDKSAPLSLWVVIRSHDTADECEKFRESRARLAHLGDLGDGLKKELADHFRDVECIGTDDPRLVK